jgi:hypothetical protein
MVCIGLTQFAKDCTTGQLVEENGHGDHNYSFRWIPLSASCTERCNAYNEL